MTKVKETWHGDEILKRMDRADARAVIGMGNAVAGHMSDAAHAISGDLKKSVHVARRETMGEIEATQQTVRGGRGAVIEVGSWLPYACVENSRGGEHRFADIGYQLAEPEFDAVLLQAWKEEGL